MNTKEFRGLSLGLKIARMLLGGVKVSNIVHLLQEQKG